MRLFSFYRRKTNLYFRRVCGWSGQGNSSRFLLRDADVFRFISPESRPYTNRPADWYHQDAGLSTDILRRAIWYHQGTDLSTKSPTVQ